MDINILIWIVNKCPSSYERNNGKQSLIPLIKMKNTGVRKVLFAFLWLTAAIQVFADKTFSENGFTYTIMEDSCSLSLVSYQATAKTDFTLPLHIPASVTHEGKTYPVKRIESNAFKGVTAVQSIIVEEGIETILDYAFECCTNLRSISIPASAEGIGKGLFGSCYNLTSVVVAADNEIYDSREGSNAIIDYNDELVVACSATTIPSSVKSIGDFAFYRCNTMEHLVIPEGVECIGNDVFFACSSLKSVRLPESLTEIGANVFCGCNSLTSIVIPKNVTKIGNGNIFTYCNNLTSIIVDNDNQNFDSRSNCNGIIRKSDSELIATCRTTTIGNDINALGDYCFDGTTIHFIHIPEAVVEISEYAFGGCNEIDKITVAPGNQKYTSPKGSNAILSKDGKTLLLGCRTTVIPEGVEAIGDRAFFGRYSKTVLRIPENVKSIGMDAFARCNAIFEAILPKSLQEIGGFAFQNCANLSVVQLLAPITISDYTFAYCYSLSTVSLPEGLEGIGCRAFYDCKSLKHITIPSSAIKIEKNAFENCPVSEKE